MVNARFNFVATNKQVTESDCRYAKWGCAYCYKQKDKLWVYKDTLSTRNIGVCDDKCAQLLFTEAYLCDEPFFSFLYEREIAFAKQAVKEHEQD